MPSSNENSGDEADRTMTPQKNAVEELREHIRQLQLALASSEQEKIQLQDVISRQQMTNNLNKQSTEAVSTNAHVASTGADLTSTVASYTTSSKNSSVCNTVASTNNAACAYANSAANGMYVNQNTIFSHTAHALAFDTTHATAGTCPNLFVAATGSGVRTMPYNANFVSPTSHYVAPNWNTPSIATPSVYAAGTPYVSSHISPTTPIENYNQMPLGLGGHPPIRKVLDLPEFHGSPEEWPMFSVAYKETTRLYAYTDLENLLRLQKALKSKARQQVESLLIHPANVNVVISTLEHHYGRPEMLIRSQIAKARAYPTITSVKISEILNFSTMVANLAAFLESSGAAPHLNNPILLDELLSKLPFSKREEWTRHVLTLTQPYPSVRDFANWLQKVALYVSMATDIMPVKQSSANEQPFTKNRWSTKPVMAIRRDDQKCSMCGENHYLFKCQKFKDSQYSERWNIVKKHNLCFSCLQPGHNLYSCTKRRQCGIQECDRFHNQLLHKEISNKNSDENNECDEDNTSVATVSGFQTFPRSTRKSANTKHRQTLLKYLPVKLKGPKGEVTAIAFIDEGAKITLLEESIANAIGVKGKSDMLRLKWIGNQTTSEPSKRVSFEIAGVSAESTTYQMSGVRTTKKLYLPAQSLYLDEFICQHQQLRDGNIFDYRHATPQLLIGLPHTHLIRPISVINIDEGFAAHHTKLGWTVFGSNEECTNNITVGHVNIEATDLYELNQQIAEYFVADNFEEKSVPMVKSEADIRAEQLLRETTTFGNGRYETGLLWCTDHVSFPKSYDTALKRLQQIEAKMNADAEYRDWYTNKIDEYVCKGYAKKLSATEANKVDDRTWYLPHFAACNPNKGNKRRLVFDAAAKVKDVSLNSALMKGPAEYQPRSLLAILLNFRAGKVAVCGDIREMFHMVLIRDEDRNSQRFLWRGGNSHYHPDVYVMSVMIFGSIRQSKPSSAATMHFLKWDEDRWPTPPNALAEKDIDLELRSKTLYTVQTNDDIVPFVKYTNLYKFLRVMTWVRIAVSKFRSLAQKKEFVTHKSLSATQINQTETFIYRLIQKTEFVDEVQTLSSGSSISKSSSIYKLCPTLDENGVIRLGGRIEYADCVSVSTKRPVILPKGHPFSLLVARHYHEMFHHHNFEAIVAAIRYKYCIPSIRRLLRTIKVNCQLCKNLAAVPQTPLMGQLPKDRLTPFVRPFSFTGVDYFGPVMVSIGRRREKRWVAIFTCLTIRAIHVELAKDLSTDAAIIVCRNFINRRGVPIRMRSDRGTNFVGASKEAWVEVEKGISSECCRRGIEWLFNAPANPSAGGVWERMVRTVKRVLQFTLKETAPQVETLHSLLIEAENLVNSRPLTHVPLEHIDDEPITPNHFLLGCPNFTQTADVSEMGCLRKQWHISQQLKKTFWKRWVLEYLPTLTRRTKWFKRVKPICVGDVVIVCDDNESRGQWKKGIVLEAKAAADGQVRSVLVKTSAGNLLRPASKIAVLDVKGDSLCSASNHGEEDVTDRS